MSNNTVLSISKTYAQADAIVRDLQSAGFTNDDISIVAPDTSGTRDFGHEKSTKASEGIAAGATAGGVTGGIVGLLAGIGTLAIPGLGALIAAGPILAALSGAAAGAATGGTIGGLIGLGIPEIEAKRYEGKLKEGNFLVAVHAIDGAAETRAKDIFKRHQAEDVSTVSEQAVPTP